MTRRVILTPAALADRRRIRAWYRQPGSGAVAQARLLSLEAALRHLAQFALVNRSSSVSGTRVLISQGHRVLYEILPNDPTAAETGDVIVLRIYGPGQSGE